MKGKRPENQQSENDNIIEPGTFQLRIKRAFITRIQSEKFPENNGHPQMTVIWEDPETEETISQNFLKLPTGLGLSGQDKYRSKFQKVLEALYGSPLTEDDSEELELQMDFIDTWEDLLEAVEGDDNGRPHKVEVKGLLVHGVNLLEKEANVTIIEEPKGDKTYYKVTNVAALPRRRAKPAQPAPAAKPTTRKAPEPVAEAPEIDEDNTPF